MADSDGRGTHHVRRAGAIHARRGAAMRGLAAASGLALGLLAAPVLLVSPVLVSPALAQDDPAVQRGVAAEATAANAVLAKERAIANAQRAAWQRYAAATGKDPNASASQIESAVTSMVVEQERSTLNGYSGRYTIRFRGARPSAPAGGGTDTASASAGGVPPLGGPVPSSRPSRADAAYVPPGTPPILPLSSYVEAGTSFRSLDEWIALRRRLLSQGSVGSVDILAISTEGARLRIGLRTAPAAAAQELAGGGVVLVPAQPPAANGLPAPTTGPGWRVGLAGGA